MRKKQNDIIQMNYRLTLQTINFLKKAMKKQKGQKKKLYGLMQEEKEEIIKHYQQGKNFKL
jgi:ERCC4-related helicase